MTVEYRPDDRQFHLHNGLISLVLRVYEDGSLGALHLGAPLPAGRSYRHLGPDRFEGFAERVGEPVPFAYPTRGLGDHRIPGLVVVASDGSGAVALGYASHTLTAGKPDLDGLPSTYAEADDEAETLTITLADRLIGLETDLRFTIFAGHPVVARSATLRAGDAALTVTTAMSVVLDLPDADWMMVHLAGAWGRETHIVEQPLVPGRQAISSTRGASGAEHNPFVALRRPGTGETAGEAVGCSLVYSGNHLAEVEVDPFGTARVRMGIEPDTFAWRLAPRASFTTPEAVVAWTDRGIGALSRAFHELYGSRLARGAWRDRPRPILLNSWEGSYFDFDQERLFSMAQSAHGLGVELFVLDDGWFGHRDSDDSSLGDWVVDRGKLPDGLEGLAGRITSLGLGFGLWIEPEMVSPDSDLYRAHPDWVIAIPGRDRTSSRRQLVLDMGRPDVVDHLTSAIGDVLASAPISYVKWDMNRSVTEPHSAALPADRQGEVFHRHILGVYELYRRLTARFPEILFESCASGGGRFDPGLLAFAPQAWTSDDTDAIERLAIQWGTSLVYPPKSIAAHVSAVPNHQTGRLTPLATRAAVAFFGVLGYELDPTRLSEAERAEVSDQIAFYRRHRELLQFGRFHRLEDPLAGDRRGAAWMTVAADAGSAIVGVYTILNRPNPGPHRLRLRGLDPEREYRVSAWPDDPSDPVVAGNLGSRVGADLMANGLQLDRTRHAAALLGDFWSRLFVLEG
jgi:alpha-galactosidase